MKKRTSNNIRFSFSSTISALCLQSNLLYIFWLIYSASMNLLFDSIMHSILCVGDREIRSLHVTEKQRVAKSQLLFTIVSSNQKQSLTFLKRFTLSINNIYARTIELPGLWCIANQNFVVTPGLDIFYLLFYWAMRKLGMSVFLLRYGDDKSQCPRAITNLTCNRSIWNLHHRYRALEHMKVLRKFQPLKVMEEFRTLYVNFVYRVWPYSAISTGVENFRVRSEAYLHVPGRLLRFVVENFQLVHYFEGSIIIFKSSF